jgi:pantoate--beta-alanine ligase
LALSSRNAYLEPEDRRRAAVLHRALQAAQAEYSSGTTDAAAIEHRMRVELSKEPEVSVEYIAVAEPATLAPVASVGEGSVVAIAARLGGIRLIDNTTLGEVLG